MLEAKTEEQREHVEKIVEKYITNTEYCHFLYADVSSNYAECVEIDLKCEDCDCELSVDIRFDMMAEIVDYLRMCEYQRKCGNIYQGQKKGEDTLPPINANWNFKKNK